MRKVALICLSIAMFVVFGWYSLAYAIDSDVTRRTLKGVPGVHVIVEDLQPNLKEYGQKFSLSRTQIEYGVEKKLQSSGIEVFARERWLKTLGRPLLYIGINTHSDKFRIAYDVKIELRQIVSMEANPEIKTLASTWSTNMTGIADVDKLDIIHDAVSNMLDRFIKAYWGVNSKDNKR
jgi:hypothetical protein